MFTPAFVLDEYLGRLMPQIKEADRCQQALSSLVAKLFILLNKDYAFRDLGIR